MENPETWGKVQIAIEEALEEYESLAQLGFHKFSDTTTIYNKLKNLGYLREGL